MTTLIGIGVMVALIVLASAVAKIFMARAGVEVEGKGRHVRVGHTVSIGRGKEADPQRAEALKVYERLAKEKLDVIKTAVAMGYKENELAALDARLEQLIGTDKLKSLLEDGAAPAVDSELMTADLEQEMERLRKAREQSRK
jgi:hypothetical protein